MSDSNPFGKAKYGAQSYTGTKIQNLKDGVNVFRVMPPFKSLAAKGAWAQYHAQHWGYRGNDSKNPGKTKSRPFRCPMEMNYKTKMVTVPCAECSRIESQKNMLDARVNNLKAQGKSDKDITEATEHLKAWLDQHSRDQKYHINAMTKDGEFVVIPLPTTAKKEIEALFEKLSSEQGIDGTDPSEGVWVTVTKVAGGRFNTTYAVDYEKESVTGPDGRKYIAAKRAPLSTEQLNKAAEGCADLTTTTRTLTAEQISALVASSGDPDDIDRIFDAGTKREASRGVSPSAAVTAKNVPVPAPVVAAPTPAPVVAAPAPAPVVTAEATDEVAALERALAAAKAAKAATAAPVAPAPVVAAAATKSLNPLDPNLSDADFMKLFQG